MSKNLDIEESVKKILLDMTQAQKDAWSALNDYPFSYSEILASVSEFPDLVLTSLIEAISESEKG